MAITRQISQYARGKVIRRVSRSVPWIGAAIAVLTVGAAIRRKGAFGGVVDTALDAMPGVGAVKNAFEAMRGRDFIKDKAPRVSMPPRILSISPDCRSAIRRSRT